MEELVEAGNDLSFLRAACRVLGKKMRSSCTPPWI